MPSRDKIMQAEVRRYREFQEIENEKVRLQSQRARLNCQISKKFDSGLFQTSVRVSKTSGGPRETQKTCKYNQIKKKRIQTGLRKNNRFDDSGNNTVMPEIQEIGILGLLRNPHEVKLKKKKKNK